MSSKIEEREAIHGQKMIEIKLRFWTNDIAEKKEILYLSMHGLLE